MNISDIVNVVQHPISDHAFASKARQRLDDDGVLVLENFIAPDALSVMRTESAAGINQAYFCTQQHSVYLTSQNENFAPDHPANRLVTSSKGCICDDMVPDTSPLRALYDHESFRSFIRAVTGEAELHPYADPLSSINIHYAKRGQELGWHFDNSSFAITLLIQKPDAGSAFEFVKNVRDADAGEMNYAAAGKILDGETKPEVLSMDSGTLVLFRGRNAMHRVTPNDSDTVRMLAVLAYNSKTGVALSESARMTFYGRLG